MCDFIKDIIATLIGVIIGGYLTYLYTVKAQRKDFLNHIKNNARIDINKSLRNYHAWLVDVSKTVNEVWDYCYLVGTSEEKSKGIKESCKKQNIEVGKKLAQEDAEEWITIIKEYESLFPKSKSIVIRLINCHEEIKSSLKLYLESPYNKFNKKNILAQLDSINYLIIYFQNVCLDEITKNKHSDKNTNDEILEKIEKTFQS